MNLSIDSKIGTSKNNPQQLIATVIVKVLGSKRLLLFTFFLFFSVPPSLPPPSSTKAKGEILQNGSRVNEMSFKVGGGELKGRISTTVCKGEYLRDGKLETEEKYIK